MIVFKLMMCTSHTEYLKPKLLNIFLSNRLMQKLRIKLLL